MKSLNQNNLHPYQWEGTDFLVDNARSALFAGLGLGKTIMTGTALVELIALGDVVRVLIVAPKRVAQSVWKPEMAEWGHTKHLRVFAAVGKPEEREQQLLRSLKGAHGICTINPENLEWLCLTLNKRNIKWPFDTIVFDEFSMFKHSGSKRFKIMERICCDRIAHESTGTRLIKSPVKRIMGLTATPAASGLENLFAQIKLLDSGERLGRKVTHFRNKYMKNVAPPGVKFQKFIPQEDADKWVYDAVADIVKVFRPEDHLDMPDLIQNDILVDIPDKTRKIMRQLEQEFLVELNEEPVIATNAGALANKLLQFSNGAVYVGDPQDPNYEKKWEAAHSAKLDALAELDETSDHPLLITYWFQSDLARICKRFPHFEVLDKKGELIPKWNRGEVQRMLVHPASAGHGLNLQYGGNTFIMYSMFWSLELYQQLIGRLHRQGQKECVTVNRIVVRNSVEQRVAASLKDRARVQDSLLDYLASKK